LLKFKPKFGITGLNPHCESIHPFNEDEKIVRPSVKFLNKKNINIKGPYAADTIFLKKNRKNYNIIVGMYHDQVLTPLKTLYEYDAINITLGLPFIRVSPDHGPNESMLGKNKSNYLSLLNSIKFLDF
ncbi:4-hydroxythreonine-4-phosphate dehydrogenase PdxA, partial [Candidatus Pelagibacter sp.]|nr:4-hydroxythreonine-4-phosphate dehydrogenase PdxA [Candidatus Pelagibacter sp.]